MKINHICFTGFQNESECIFAGHKMVLGVGMCQVVKCILCNKELVVDKNGSVILG